MKEKTRNRNPKLKHRKSKKMDIKPASILLSWTIIMGLFMMVGGSAGYYNKGSIMSLMGGGSLGLWYFWAARSWRRNKDIQMMKLHMRLCSLVLSCFFAFRYLQTGKTMALVIAGSGLVTLIVTFLFNSRKK